MAVYLVQFTYTSETWATLTKHPQDRSIPTRDLVQKFGGKLLGLYYCLDEYDGIVLFEAPDDLSASAVTLAAKASGSFKENKITRLLTVEEAREAMLQAGRSPFSNPTD